MADISTLLWLCIWLPEFTLLHIPKTGGSSIEAYDATTPLAQFKILRNLVRRSDDCPFTFFAARRGDTNRSAVGCLIEQPRCTWDGSSLWHMTPSQLRDCGLRSSVDPYPHANAGQTMAALHIARREQQLTFCVVRDPLERFFSAYRFAREHHNIWPVDKCPRDKDGSLFGWPKYFRRRPSPYTITKAPSVRQELECLGTELESLLAGYNRSRQLAMASDASGERPVPSRRAWAFSELFVQFQPQSHFVRECDIVFSYSDLQRAGTRTVNRLTRAGRRAFIGAEAKAFDRSQTLRATFSRVYAADLELWERVKAHHAPSAAHRPLHAWVSHMRQRFPRLLRKTPTCGSREDECSCHACCGLQAQEDCMQCVLSRPECGGPGLRERGRLSVSRDVAGPLCRRLPLPVPVDAAHPRLSCNTCPDCCELPYVGPTGSQCALCERRLCSSHGSSPVARIQYPYCLTP